MECPCCENETLNGRDNYEICPVCFWEDDAEVGDDLLKESMCNKQLNIIEARENFLQWGAVELRLKEFTIPYEEFKAQNKNNTS